MKSETTPTFGHGKICYIIIPSKDPARSAQFYQHVFGWLIRDNGDGSISFDDSVNQVSGLWTSTRPVASDDGIEIHIMVHDLRQTIDTIRDSGGTVLDDEVHLGQEKWCLFRDPDRNKLGLYQHPVD